MLSGYSLSNCFQCFTKVCFASDFDCINSDCRKYTVCTSNCFNLKINKIKIAFFRELVNLCKKLSVFSCSNVIIDAFETYKSGEDYFFSQYLEIKRGRKG